ncbi:MBL fold metallo-hydrolase [Streptomyces gilvus]|uniref:MBL fold metallo-hydrolase n=1 Tax=Streptomyces gilvus TaxID=2920937 RepID=UPI001F10F413|nr:MBL fold metallo-hydrolase [Streptomyces sp. CME 23]MCH5675622.1 MBL fold metallo-hydrolase [Streptomyces sp. CME 23]
MTSPAPQVPDSAGIAAGQRPLPPVSQVRPGIWSIPVPLPNTSLRYVLVYVFETDAGPYLVDAGWDTDEAFDTLAAGLAGVGTRIEDVQGVLVTHVHPDHYGLAGRVRAASGAWISLHPADADVLSWLDDADLVRDNLAMLRNAGAPQEVLERQRRRLRALDMFGNSPRPDVLMEDGARPDVPGWELSAIWTPGHSPGHLCFWEPRHRLMLTGDHVLPRITPNVPAPRDDEADPLGDFLRSLDRLAGRGACEVLPAHERRFTDLDGRLEALRHHHDKRFAEVLSALEAGADVAWDVAAHMHWSRPWQQMEGLAQQAAVGEASAHLRALARRGVVREERGEPARWRLMERS